MAFGRHDTPGQVAQRAAAASYTVENRYSGETFEHFGSDDVQALLWEWLEEDGYEFAEGEQWFERRWQDFADGYVVTEDA